MTVKEMGACEFCTHRPFSVQIAKRKEGASVSGCLFRYVHTKDEPKETLDMAVRIACTVAEGAAIDTGRNHVVARYTRLKGYTVFPAGHRALESSQVVPVFELTPASECIRLEQ